MVGALLRLGAGMRYWGVAALLGFALRLSSLLVLPCGLASLRLSRCQPTAVADADADTDTDNDVDSDADVDAAVTFVRTMRKLCHMPGQARQTKHFAVRTAHRGVTRRGEARQGTLLLEGVFQAKKESKEFLAIANTHTLADRRLAMTVPPLSRSALRFDSN